MKNSLIRKPISILLSLLMVLSVFGGMAFTASAESKTIAEGVIYKLGDTIVLPGNGNYYVKENKYSTRTVSGNGTVTQFEGDGYSYAVKINGWDIYTYLDTFGYWEEMEQGLSVLGITFTGSGTQSDPYLLKLALGEVESTWAGEGEGTEASPWLIKDLNDLRTLSANVASGMTYSGKYLKLAADIDCGSDNWEPIGGDKPFAGTFDGDGKTITYSIICSEDDIPKGLFAKIGSAGTVKNLNVAGSIVNTAEYAGPAGGIAADNFGLIENCYSAVDITKGCDRGTGGIAAFNNEGATIRYCAASGTLTWTGASDFYAYIGGITCQVYESTVTNSTSLCNVLAENAQDSGNYAGIFIGRNVNNYATPECYYLSTAATAGFVNKDGAEPKTPDELKVIGQAAYDAGYTVYGLALGATDPDQEAADAVIALIDAIGEVVLTDECKQKIDAARNAYDALTDEQKALVSKYETLQLAEGQYAALQLAADMTAFEAYKTAKKAAMDALLQEGDSDTVQSIVGLAKTQIDAATYDESKTLDENKTALDTLVANVPTAIATQRAAEALAAAKAAAKAALDNYKNAADYRAAEKEALATAIAEAKAAIDAAADIAAVNAAVAAAHTAMDAIKTDADLTAEELAAAKIAAKAALDTYKSADDYRTAEKEDLATAIAEAKAAIDAAADIAAVEAAVAAAHTAMDAIKTDAELTAEELAAAKIAAKAALDNYKNAADYRTAEKEALATAIAEAKAAIDAAADIAAVNAVVEAAKTSIDTIKTDAELTAEEEAAAAAAALADAKAQLTTAVESAKAFYDTIKDNEKYADIANALKTAYERGEAALASDDPAEILDFAANVAFATTTAQTDKAAADAEPTDEPSDPTDEPSNPDTPDTPSDEKEVKVGNPFLYNIIKAVVDFIVSLFTKVLPAAMKLK